MALDMDDATPVELQGMSDQGKRQKVTIYVQNMHCPSCTTSITEILSSFNTESSPDAVGDINVSLVDGTVTFTYLIPASDRPYSELDRKVSYSPSWKSLASDFPIFPRRNAQKEDVSLLDQVSDELESNGFEIVRPSDPHPAREVLNEPSWKSLGFLRGYMTRKGDRRLFGGEVSDLARDLDEKLKAHLMICESCRQTHDGRPGESKTVQGGVEDRNGGEALEAVPTGSKSEPRWSKTQISIVGMTCSSCISAVENSLSGLLSTGESARGSSPIRSVNVSLFPPSATVVHDETKVTSREIVETIEDAGYGAELVDVVEEEQGADGFRMADDQEKVGEAKVEAGWFESKFAIEGMTCSSCVNSVQEALSPESTPAIRSVNVTLFPASATVVHDTSTLTTDGVRETIEDRGYGAKLYESTSLLSTSNGGVSETTVEVDGGANALGKVSGRRTQPKTRTKRKVKVIVEGMFCPECSARVNQELSGLKSRYPDNSFSFTPISHTNPISSLSYNPIPGVKGLNLRRVKSSVESLGFTLSVDHEESLEARGRRAQLKERRLILIRFGVSFLFAIPTFVIAVVGMSLLSADDSFRLYWDEPVWGGASRGTVSLFALATPVQFGVGSYFYARSWKSLRGVWRRGRGNLRKSWRRVWFDRLIRWGSMDSLVTLGTSLAYFASLAYMILDITGPTSMGGGTMSYFDTSVFLMFFILAGRYLEAKAKSKTSEAITELGKIRPTTGILHSDYRDDEDGKEDLSRGRMEEVGVDFIEVGDVLLVPVGSSPPLDCILAESSPQTSFDESSLTGESRPVIKGPGDQIFSGTINGGPSAAVAIVESGQGSNVIDSIVRSVRDAMGRKAGLERLADQVTGYFVPCIVAIACVTFVVWLLCGYLGALPEHWLGDGQRGSWALFAIQFGVAVLLTACPCGIGLAAPTAQMVGMGLAAKQGILVRGVEAFQTFRKVTTIVFDKTGTLTTSEFRVSHAELLSPEFQRDKGFASNFWEMLRVVEESSTHPISVGLQKFCVDRLGTSGGSSGAVRLISSEEIPGRGLSAVSVIGSSTKVEMIVGNESLMDEKHATYVDQSSQENVRSLLSKWQGEGKSVVIVAARTVHADGEVEETSGFDTEDYRVLAIFAVHDPPRPEAPFVIEQLRKLGVESYMITGDNEKTARAVAALVGIDHDKVIAGVLPVGKRDWIERLQRTAVSARSEEGPSKSRWKTRRGRSGSRPMVAFVGDGINDAPAIAQADAGIAMGSGSTVAISTSDFCLLSSSLTSLLTLHSLANATIRKIITNFVWACLYNVCLIPLAAGAFYAIGDKQTRLPPVWASLAMALSSVSVMVNSLLLRWLYRPPRAVREWKGKTGL